MDEPGASPEPNGLRDRVRAHLRVIYPDHDPGALAERVLAAIGIDDAGIALPPHGGEPTGSRLGVEHAVLITYGDTLTADEPGLVTLARFVASHLDPALSVVHVLPFFPSSSDEGFAVIDHRRVRPELGGWAAIEALAAERSLMADLVINHVSASSPWVADLIADREPGRRYLKTAEPDDDLAPVVRARTHPLLRPVSTAAGPRWLWCTFSPDQVDLDLDEPDVLCELLGIIDVLLGHGCRWIRLDAVAYAFKRPGSASIHLAETHELVALLRTLVEGRDPEAVLVAETNVPVADNLTYLGDGDRAHLVYNFCLAPLLVDALLSGRSTELTRGLAALPPAPPGCAYLNLVASHDGIGLRPAEGLLSEERLAALVDTVTACGGQVSSFSTPEGEQPYELNVSLFSLMGRTHRGPDRWQVERFVCAHAVMLAVAGVPALYLHSLLATPNAPADRGPRAINRARRALAEVEAELADPEHPSARVLGELNHLLAVRRAQSAFDPASEQTLYDLGPELFACRRRSGGQTIVAVSNLTDSAYRLDVGELIGDGVDVLSGERLTGSAIELAPYASVWLSDRA